MNGADVLSAAVFVRDPFAVFSGIVQIEHGCDSVDPQAIDVILLEPEQGVAYKEVFDFVSCIVEDIGAPLFVLALARVGVLVKVGAIEESQSMPVFGEVSWNPVENYANTGIVESVD